MSKDELKNKLSAVTSQKRKLTQQVGKLKEKFAEELEKNCIFLEEKTSDALSDVLNKNTSFFDCMDKESPMYLVWQQQQSALNATSKSGHRWHPTMIKWCISLFCKIPVTYNMMRQSKFLLLPHLTSSGNTKRLYLLHK